MNADITSDTYDLTSQSGFAWHHVWTDGTNAPAGTLYTQASNNGTDWETIDSETLTDGAGSKLVNVSGAYYKYTRTFWDATSGTGATLSSWLFGKES